MHLLNEVLGAIFGKPKAPTKQGVDDMKAILLARAQLLAKKPPAAAPATPPPAES